jgi:hypothetical protein
MYIMFEAWKIVVMCIRTFIEPQLHRYIII